MKGEKKRIMFIILLCVFLILFVYYIFFIVPLPPTGFGTSTTASVLFNVLGEPFLIILHPYGNNYTYNFGIGEPYILDLNISSDSKITSFVYSLYDVHHNRWVYQDIAFSPNTTLEAVRWTNNLSVMGYTNDGKNVSDNAVFFINVSNSAPVIYGINNSIYVCENSELFYKFYAFDADEDILTEFISSNPYFFIFPRGQDPNNLTINDFVIISALIHKNAVGGINNGAGIYPVSVSVSDGANSDTVSTNITAIEINNPPIINPPLGLTTETIWNIGANSTLFKWINVSDVEYDLYGYGNHSFNLTITNSTNQRVDLFDLILIGGNASINFTANRSTPLGNYNVRICVNDTGLTRVHPRIFEECGQTGSSIKVCDNFQLTITDQNRPPTIIKHYPNNSNIINVSGDDPLYFNITKYDPDGTIPDAYWYVDGIFQKYDKGSLFDEFTYRFGCGISDLHKIKVEITDGELNDSLSWNISVSYIPCAQPPPSGGGGGGGGGGALPRCIPTWVCNTWGVCQIAQVSLQQGLLSGVDYRRIKEICDLKQISDERCGFQVRECIDLINCSSSYGKPFVVDYCLYVENPNCNDGIKDCHDGDCEVLIDCGGPCKPCPSCTDGIRNQEEEGTDCGGPCPWKCIPEVPLLKRKEVVYGFLLLLLIIIILIIIKLIRVLRYKRAIRQSQKPKI